MRPAPGSRCPSPSPSCSCSPVAYPLWPLRPAKLTLPSGFPRHLAPTVMVSFLSPSHPERKGGGGRPDLNKEREESQGKRKLQPPPGSSRSPSPLPRSARAQRSPPGPGGGARGCAPRSLRREVNWLGPWDASWRAGGRASRAPGIPGSLPKTEPGSGNPQSPPTRDQPPPAAASPAIWCPGRTPRRREAQGSRLTGERAGAGERREESSTAQLGQTLLLHYPPSVLESSARPAAADLFCSRARARHLPEVPPLAAATTPRLPGQRRGGGAWLRPRALWGWTQAQVPEPLRIF